MGHLTSSFGAKEVAFLSPLVVQNGPTAQLFTFAALVVVKYTEDDYILTQPGTTQE